MNINFLVDSFMVLVKNCYYNVETNVYLKVMHTNDISNLIYSYL
jgi:hypothetical protein